MLVSPGDSGSYGGEQQQKRIHPGACRAEHGSVDSVSGKLNGVFDTITDATYTGPAANTAQLTTVGPNDLNFLLAFTFGTANAANSVTVKEFSLNIL